MSRRDETRIWSWSDATRALLYRADGRLPFLDGLRALSILFVIGYHSFQGIRLFNKPVHEAILNSPVRHLVNGEMGVDIFFVLSGFLIGGMLIREIQSNSTLDFRSFYARRALRILPAYYVLLAISVGLEQAGVTQAPVCSTDGWQNVLFINNLINIGVPGPKCVPWSWSLCIEEQFYLLAPLTLLLLRGRRLLPGLLLLFTFAFAIRVATGLGVFDGPKLDTVQNLVLYFRSENRFGALIAGVISAALVQGAPRLGAHRAWLWLGVALVAGMCVPVVNRMQPRADQLFLLITQRYFLAMGVALVIWNLASSEQPSFVRSFLSWKLWFPVAQLSYAMYLLNNLVFTLVYPQWTPTSIASWAMIALPASIAITMIVSAVMFIAIEHPFMQMRSRIRPRRSAPRVDS